MSSPSDFNFRLCVTKFQKVAECVESDGHVQIEPFADAMSEFTKVFAALGSGFAFAFKDLQEKIETLQKCAPVYQNVRSLLEQNSDNAPPKDKPVASIGGAVSPTRAVNRPAHVCAFLTLLFEGLMRDPTAELKPVLTQAYDASLVQIHGFVVRNAVKAAFNVVPKRANFLAAAGVTETDIVEIAPGFVQASKAVTDLIAKEFADRQVPWVFS